MSKISYYMIIGHLYIEICYLKLSFIISVEIYNSVRSLLISLTILQSIIIEASASTPNEGV